MIYGIARGIAYLHENYHVTIIHRNIKPSNILVDSEFQAKIADFGLARLLRTIWAMSALNSQAHCKFRKCLNLLQHHWNDIWWRWWWWWWWIRGYTAPEYAVSGHLSEKVDIYSFGVVVLEIISGQRCSDLHTNSDSNSDSIYLLDEVHFSLYKRHVSVTISPKMAKCVRFSKILILCRRGKCGMHQKLADEMLDRKEYRVEQVKKMVEIGLICTQSPASSRPSMSEILAMMLSDGKEEMRAPQRPNSVIEGKNASLSSASNATLSFSNFTAR